MFSWNKSQYVPKIKIESGVSHSFDTDSTFSSSSVSSSAGSHWNGSGYGGASISLDSESSNCPKGTYTVRQVSSCGDMFKNGLAFWKQKETAVSALKATENSIHELDFVDIRVVCAEAARAMYPVNAPAFGKLEPNRYYDMGAQDFTDTTVQGYINALQKSTLGGAERKKVEDQLKNYINSLYEKFKNRCGRILEEATQTGTNSYHTIAVMQCNKRLLNIKKNLCF